MEAPESSSPANRLCREIERRRLEALEGRISQYPRNNPIASDLSPCTRETALAILHWKDRPAPDAGLKARFERGSLIEDAVLRELGALGFTVRKERTPFEVKDSKGRIVVRGIVDGFLDWREEGTKQRDFPLEVKSLDPNIYRQINGLEDFQKFHFTKKYPRQLWTYLYANSLEEGFFLLDDCTGRWKLIPVALDYAETETILRQCEAAVDAVAAASAGVPEGTDPLPAYHEDPAVCRRCWAFGRVCYPPIEEQGLKVLAEPEFEAKLERRHELAPAFREYETLDKEVKERVKGQDGLVLGRFLIRGKEVTRHMKAQPERDVTFWQPKIEVIKGEAGDDA
jgi:hypothetical protein